MSLFGINDYILMPLAACALVAAIFCGVVDMWIAFAVCLATALGFLGIWLRLFIPRYRLRRCFLFKTRGVSYFSLPGAAKPAVVDVYREMDRSLSALGILLPDTNVSTLLDGVQVYLVPDIDEKAYPDLKYYRLTGLDFGKYKLVVYKPGTRLNSTALAHELCHTPAVHTKYPDSYEAMIDKALRTTRAGW